MATDIERLMVRLEANATSFEKALKKADQAAARDTAAIEKKFERTNSRIASLMNSTASTVSSGLGRLGALAGAYLSTDALRRYADAWQETINKIAAANLTRQGADRRASQLADIAIGSNADLGATTDLYAGLTRASRDLGASQAQVLNVTETISKAFAVGGQSAATQAGAITQLNQALQSGALRGDEFNSVAEGAPVLMDLIAKKMNVTRGELKGLAADGKITSKILFDALLEGGAAVEAQFAKMTPTVEQSVAKLKAALTRYFGQIAQDMDLSGKVAAATNAVLANLDTVVKAAAVAGVAISAAFAGGPIIAGIAAAGAALALFGDQVHPIAGDIATLGDYARVAFEYISTNASEGASAIAGELKSAIDTIVGLLSGDLPASAQTFMTAVTGAIDAVLNAFQFAGDAISIAWNAAASSVAGAMIGAMNEVIAAVNRAVSFMIDRINAIRQMAGSLPLTAPKFEEFKNDYAAEGASAGEKMSKAFEKRFAQTTVRDGLSKVGAEIEAGVRAFRDKANAKADGRAEFDREARRARGLSRPDDGSLNQKLTAPKGSGGGGGGGGGRGGAGKQSDYDKESEALEKRILALGREKEALSLSAFEAAKAEAANKLLDAAKKDGTPITEELTRKINAQAEAYARAKVALEEAKNAQQAFKELQTFVGQSMSGFFSDIVSGGKNASEALMNLTKKLADAALQAALLGSGPLAGLFGLKGQNGGAGGLIGALFGGFKFGGGGGGGGGFGLPQLYAGGGYTGAGGKHTPAGVVHAGEFVMSQEAVKRIGLRNLMALHDLGKRGYASGGFVGPSAPPLSMFAPKRGPEASPVKITIDLAGANGDEAIKRIALAASKQAYEQAVATVRRNIVSITQEGQMRFGGAAI